MQGLAKEGDRELFAESENKKQLNKNLPIVMSRDITQARFSMGLWERRLMYVCMSKISENDADFKEIIFSVAEMGRLLDTNLFGGKTYELIVKAGSDVAKRQVHVKEGPLTEIIPWFEYFSYDDDKHIVTMKFNKRMKPHLLFALKNKGYTKFLLSYAMPLSSVYSQRFYEMFRGLVYTGMERAVQRIELNELKSRLDIPSNSYKNYGMFKKGVLQVAEEDINKKTEIFISFSEIKGTGRGRPVIAINVCVVLKRHMIKDYQKILLWEKSDIIEKLAHETVKMCGQIIELKRLLHRSHESLAELTYRVINKEINLKTVNNVTSYYDKILENYEKDNEEKDEMLAKEIELCDM